MPIALASFVPLACEKNAEFGITGLILSGNNFYLQVLEGKREYVNQLYRNIVNDKRHTSCTLLRYTDIKTRDFADWSMIHTTVDELHNSYLDVIVSPEEFSVKLLTGIKAMAILRRVSAHMQFITKKENT